MAERRRVTIEDVARKAGVSTMTISRALNGNGAVSPATRRHVLDVVEELNYIPSRIARSLTTKQTFTIGLVVPDISNPFFATVVRGVEDVAWQHHYNILLCNTVEQPERERSALRLLEETEADGLILCSPRLPDEQLFPLLQQHQAVVVLNRPLSGRLADLVRIDDRSGGFQAADHLLRAKRSKPAYLAGPTHTYSSQARLQGIRQAAQAAQVALNPAWQRPCPPTWEGGFDLAKTLLAETRQIDGLICYNDLIAVGALHACRQGGLRIPEDIAIIGFDDILLARMTSPALTTLGVSKYDVGAKLMERLIGRMQDQTDLAARDEIIIQPELIIRESTP